MKEITVDGYKVSKKLQVEQYIAILSHGPTWTGNLISKSARTALVTQGYIRWDDQAVDSRHKSPGAYIATFATLRYQSSQQATLQASNGREMTKISLHSNPIGELVLIHDQLPT